jgi:hypothetical protein
MVRRPCPGPSGQLKTVGPATVRRLATTKRVLVPDDGGVLTLDVTRSAPEETAKAILGLDGRFGGEPISPKGRL